MKTNILTLAITLTLGVILAGSLLMPVISDATTTERTILNENGLYSLDKINANEDFTLEWDYTAPQQVTVNDEVIQLHQGTFPLTVFFNESLMIRVVWNDNISVFETSDDTGAYPIIGGGISGQTNLTVTNVNGTLTMTDGTNTVERTNSDGMIASNGGAYIMKGSTEEVFLTGDSEFYAAGYTYRALDVVGSGFVAIIKGTINDGFTIISQVPSTYTESDETQTYTQVTGQYKDLYKYTGFAFTLSDGTNSKTVSYSQIIVPASVSAELSQHLNPGEIAIMNAIPFMIIAVLVVMAAGALYLKRED